MCIKGAMQTNGSDSRIESNGEPDQHRIWHDQAAERNTTYASYIGYV